MNVIEIKNLCYSYDKNSEVLKKINLSIECGEHVAIVGHNGSGKSTLAKLLVGLIEKDSGDINILGMNLDYKNIHAIRQQVSIVFQNPDNQFVATTVEDDIAFGLENRCLSYEQMHKIVPDFAKKVGMEEYLDKEPSSLSGGQKQRVALAGALSLEPKILILDEATSMLDPKGKSEITHLLTKMRKNNQDLTVISITHDVEEAYLCDRVFVLNNGQIVLSGRPDEVFENGEEIHKLGLEQPLLLKLKKELEKIGIDISNDKTIEEVADSICR